MTFLALVFITYFLPLIISGILMIIFEFLCKKLNRKEDSIADISALIFLPLINWVLVVILPIGVTIFGAEYLGILFVKILNKI